MTRVPLAVVWFDKPRNVPGVGMSVEAVRIAGAPDVSGPRPATVKAAWLLVEARMIEVVSDIGVRWFPVDRCELMPIPAMTAGQEEFIAPSSTDAVGSDRPGDSKSARGRKGPPKLP